MFPPVTQRIAQNAIIGGAGSQQHGAPRHAAGSTHAGHGHVTWPRMARRVATHGTTSMPASLGALAAAVVGLPRATVGCRPPSDASPPRLPPPFGCCLRPPLGTGLYRHSPCGGFVWCHSVRVVGGGGCRSKRLMARCSMAVRRHGATS